MKICYCCKQTTFIHNTDAFAVAAEGCIAVRSCLIFLRLILLFRVTVFVP